MTGKILAHRPEAMDLTMIRREESPVSSRTAQATTTDAQRCGRCGALMFCDVFIDTGASFEAWHCLICGEIWDERIQENRLHRPGSSRGRPPKWSRMENFGARNGRRSARP